MTRKILLITFLLSAQFAIGQVFNQTDSLGRKIGLWKKVYSNGKIRYQGEFDKGIPKGNFNYYNANGLLTSTLTYSNEGTYAKVKMFNSDGKISATGFYHNQIKDSTWLIYFESSDSILAEENYKDSLKDGRWLVYFNNGQVSSEIHWKNNVKDGSWIEYFKNGNKQLNAYYKNGNLDGDYIAYNIDGKVIKQGKYINGKPDGIWKEYDENGNILFVNKYNKGWLAIEETYEKGVLKSTTNHGLRPKVVKKQ